MRPDAAPSSDTLRELQRRLGRAPPTPALVAEVLAQVRARLAVDDGEAVIPLLETLVKRAGASAEALSLLGHAHRQAQSLTAADRAFAAARRLDGTDPMLALAAAQTRYQLGLPAAEAFLEAGRLLPPGREEVRLAALSNAAQARLSEGDAPGGEALLRAELARRPDWLEGHRVLSRLLWVSGRAGEHDASFPAALAAAPGLRALWLAWFQSAAQIRDWDRAREILDRAEAACGHGPDLMAARLFVATEGGTPDEAGRLMQETADLQGDGVTLCRVRALLRQGRAAEAAAMALPGTTGPSAMTFWPYLSLAWRLMGDDRAEWLDGPTRMIRTLDLGLDRREREGLTDLLRHLHTLERPYAEQSVRGGTQTDRSILLRGEPQLQRLRRHLLEGVAEHVAGLPAMDAGHPLLGQRRDRLRIAGSWSVRLAGQGYNVAHTHPVGWISAVYYVSLPPPEQMGPAPAGWITFGAPPPELGLSLEPYAQVEPRPGRLVLFPSHMWHGTQPFSDGERLVVAFDLQRHPARAG